MAAQATENPLPTFTGLNGQPLSNGYVYFGQPDQDPREYQISVYYDEALTVPVVQPLRTNAGYLYRNGSPTRVWVNGNYSTLVLDSTGRQVFYAPDWTAGSAANIAFIQPYADAQLRDLQSKVRESVSVLDFEGVYTDGVTDSTAGIQAAFDSGAKHILIPDNNVFILSATITADIAVKVTGRGELRWVSGIAQAPAIQCNVDHCDFDGVWLTNPNALQSQTGGRNIGIFFEAGYGRVVNCRLTQFQNSILVAFDGEFSKFIISNNFCEDCIGAGNGPSDPTSPYGEDRGDGITVWGAQATITGNVVSAKVGQDCRIGIHGEALGSFEPTPILYGNMLMTVTGNVVLGSFRRSIVLEEIDCGTVTGNTVAGATWWGIALARTTRSNCVGNAIYIDRAANNQSGAFWSPTYAGITAYGSCGDCTIANNVIDISTGYAWGISLFGLTGPDVGLRTVVTGNTVRGNASNTTANGIYAAFQTDTVISSNTVSNIKNYGVFTFTVDTPTILGNRVIGVTGVDGIHDEASTTAAVISDNHISGFATYAINASGRSGLVCNGNTLTGASAAFFSCTNSSIQNNRLSTGTIQGFTASCIVSGNVGFITENYGAVTQVTDGTGRVTFPHGLAGVPDTINAMGTGGTYMHFQQTAVDATNITLQARDAAGADIASTSLTFYWQAAFR